jgi:hypothetical protein
MNAPLLKEWKYVKLSLFIIIIMFICSTVLEEPITEQKCQKMTLLTTIIIHETKLTLNDIHPNFYL